MGSRNCAPCRLFFIGQVTLNQKTSSSKCCRGRSHYVIKEHKELCPCELQLYINGGHGVKELCSLWITNVQSDHIVSAGDMCD